jgi:hypothetical protein
MLAGSVAGRPRVKPPSDLGHTYLHVESFAQHKPARDWPELNDAIRVRYSVNLLA